MLFLSTAKCYISSRSFAMFFKTTVVLPWISLLLFHCIGYLQNFAVTMC
jgi:hypothetical protein